MPISQENIHITLHIMGAFSSLPPPQWGELDLNSSNSGCARLGSGVAPLSGWLKKKLPS